MNNKKIITIIITLAIILIGVLIYNLVSQPDSIKFKKEYETYNDVTLVKGNEKTKYHNLTIDKDNPIIYLNDDNIVEELTTGNKIIYFGFPECNWCRAALPILFQTAKDNGIEEIYYYNLKNIRTAYEEGKDQKGIYQKIINQIGDNVKETYTEGKQKGVKRLSTPTVILVKDGKVENYHNKTVESHTEYDKNLNKKEKEELYQIYEDIMIDYIMCTSNC